MRPNVFAVPAGVPFLTALARAIINGDLPAEGGARPDPLDLPKITLMLPTRRAARAVREAFLGVAKSRALILPRILAISEGDADSSLIANLSSSSLDDGAALEALPAISGLERTLTLMQLVGRWREAMEQSGHGEDAVSGSTPAQAAHLANELAKLMDDVERENVSLSRIKDLVPDAYAEHWRRTVDFLKIVTEFWPEHLKAQGLASPQARRNQLIEAEAKRIEGLKDDEIVIVAGVTGSIPATVSLMRAVIARRQGAIVLPALDQSLHEDSWGTIAPGHPEHPQFALKQLTNHLGLARKDIRVLKGATLPSGLAERGKFFAEAMRPSATTSAWHRYTADADPRRVKAALKGVARIEAPSAHDEAEAVALILREAIETPGRTAALVSPDRVLARRVAIRLEAWGIRVDDSAGRPFAKTVPGTLLALVIGAALSDFAPAETMALLHHPLSRAGLKAFDIRRFARALEISAFRAPYLGKGLDGILAALAKADDMRASKARMHPAAKRLWKEDCDGARDLVQRLQHAFAPLTALYANDEHHTLADFARAHAAAAEAIAVLPDDEDAEAIDRNPLWHGEAGDAASQFFASLLLESAPSVEIRAADYADLYATLLARENVRERTAVHPRVAIWGPFEARLQQADVVVLGSLNEGTWPKAAETGAWLNRPMRAELGLPAPEEEIGRMAHDFVSLLGAEQVYLTRATKSGGVPTVPSRWLMRINALLAGMKLDDALKADRPWLSWARARDHIDIDGQKKIAPPAPAPPLDLRPRKMSVTEIERWIANPYAVFARHVLKLETMPALGPAPDHSLKGALIHEVMSRFAQAFPEALPNDLMAELEKIAANVLESYTGHPRIAAFWLPRLRRFLTWFAMSEADRRKGISRIVAETAGSLVLDSGGRPFTLTARADRIDDNGRDIIITDYKSGGIPRDASVLDGRAPQLPLEAAIALGESGFPGLAGRSVACIRYIRASGGEPPGEEHAVKADVAELAGRSRAGLERLIALFDDPRTPYRATRRAAFRYDYDDYAHLARVAEWSAYADEEAP